MVPIAALAMRKRLKQVANWDSLKLHGFKTDGPTGLWLWHSGLTKARTSEFENMEGWMAFFTGRPSTL
jgi:hypothetical protein